MRETSNGGVQPDRDPSTALLFVAILLVLSQFALRVETLATL